jgi:hypothetical protein
VDHLRSVRTQRFKYIRNYLPERPHLQPNVYKDHKPTYVRLRELHSRGELTGLPRELLFSQARAKEVLYDMEADPFETHNLANDPEHADELAAMRKRLATWESETGDRGRQPEPDKMYDSDMAVYLRGRGGSAADRVIETEQNIALMKRWAREGK